MVRKISLLALCLLAGLLISPALNLRQTAAGAATSYTLSLSKSPDRSSPANLGGQTVAGNIYVFVSPEAGITQVRFYIDNASATGTPYQTENIAPYDLAGGTTTAANPYDTKKLSNGSHTVTVLITKSSGQVTKMTSRFTVSNGWATSTPAPTPTKTAAPTATTIAPPTATRTPAPTPTKTPAPTSQPTSSVTYSLLLSKLSDRSFPTNLQGQNVARNIYVFLSPETGVIQVRFYLDDTSASGTPTSTENLPPFDFAGGNSGANPYDTRQLADGGHTLTASISLSSGGVAVVTAAFDVRNVTPVNSAIYWGAAIQDVPWNMTQLTNWEAMAGKPMSIVHFWQFWSENGTALQPFHPEPLNLVRDHGSIPLVTWSPERMGGGKDQPEYQLADIIAGNYDGYISAWATAAKNWGHPFFIRFAHEMNGSWFPWNEGVNGNQPGQFVPAWKRVVDIFRSAGANNVTWVWCPNVDYPGSGRTTMQSVYPGDSYVDWTCLDGYNWGGAWESFSKVFRWSYEDARSIVANKPMMLGEFASAEAGGSKADWITSAFTSEIPFDFPGLKAIVWYNVLTDHDWRVESSQASVDAFKASIASPYYSPNVYGGIGTSPTIPAIQ